MINTEKETAAPKSIERGGMLFFVLNRRHRLSESSENDSTGTEYLKTNTQNRSVLLITTSDGNRPAPGGVSFSSAVV